MAATYKNGVEYDVKLKKSVKYRGATLRPSQTHRILGEVLNGADFEGAIDDAKPAKT